MRKFVYVDTESTGLDADKDKLIEMAYAIENGPIKELYFGVREVTEFIADLTKRGYNISPPDHSAAGDVRSLREIHVALVQEREDA